MSVVGDSQPVLDAVAAMYRTIMSGVPVRTSVWLPRTTPVAVDDAEERWAAMTAHHLALDLLPLVRHEPAFFAANLNERVMVGFPGEVPQPPRTAILCHPDNLTYLMELCGA